MADSRDGDREHKMRLEHYMVPEIRRHFKNYGDRSKDTGANWNKLSVAKYATIWATK